MQGRRDATAIPALLAEEQWEALGRRLQGIESSLQVSQVLHPALFKPAVSGRQTGECFLPMCPSQPPAHEVRFTEAVVLLPEPGDGQMIAAVLARALSMLCRACTPCQSRGYS